jgi:hypothetical protein
MALNAPWRALKGECLRKEKDPALDFPAPEKPDRNDIYTPIYYYFNVLQRQMRYIKNRKTNLQSNSDCCYMTSQAP